jgi:capsular polysaccharide transport system ATP-binding protein
MIRMRAVTKTYKLRLIERPVLDNCTIDIPTDRRLAIFGLPGSGKTTLMHLLTGLTEPNAGEIERFARLSFPVGYLRALKATLSARQNVVYACRVYGANVAEVSEFIERITGLGSLLDEPLRRLPVADRQLFASTLTYAIPFDTYMIDGHFGPGGPRAREKCLAMLEARAETSGLIFATSHRTIALRLCDTGAVLNDGQVELYEDIRDAAEAFERLESERAMQRELSAMDEEYGEDAMEDAS